MHRCQDEVDPMYVRADFVREREQTVSVGEERGSRVVVFYSGLTGTTSSFVDIGSILERPASVDKSGRRE